ncbi:Jouberin [Borealophlyctis nickersoniae]|nr:Jouberin [Borealophlyctis nickersoniae]
MAVVGDEEGLGAGDNEDGNGDGEERKQKSKRRSRSRSKEDGKKHKEKKKKKKKKKGAKGGGGGDDGGDPDKEFEEEEAAEPVIPTIFDHVGKRPEDFEGFATVVRVHAADALEPDVRVVHPVVQVSFVDLETGEFIQKSNPARPATTFNETETVDYILPVLTKPFSLSKSHTVSPQWEEDIFINEDYLRIVDGPVAAFFEVLDFGANQRDLKGFVTISGHPAWDSREVTSRPKLPTEIERGKLSLDQLLNVYEAKKRAVDPMMKSLMELGPKVITNNLRQNKTPGFPQKSISKPFSKNQPTWRRLPGQRCKIPNKPKYRIDPGPDGAFACSFSSTGIYLAIACMSSTSYPVKIYSVLTGDRVATLEGHRDLVYEMAWSEDDSNMISASSDGSVRTWLFAGDGTVRRTGIIQHPSFVYTTAFHPTAQNPCLIATGSYDTFIRLYPHTTRHHHHNNNNKQSPDPVQVLKGHTSNVNSIVFDRTGARLYSADGAGCVRVWSSNAEGVLGKSEEEVGRYLCIQSVAVCQGTPITTLRMHPSTRKLLLQTPDGLHTLDTRIYRILTTFTPSSSPFPAFTTHTSSSPLTTRPAFTPCGHYVLSGQPDGSVVVYKTDSGRVVGRFGGQEDTKAGKSIVDVCYHPHDFFACFVGLGEAGGVRVWSWEEGVDGGNDQHLLSDASQLDAPHPTQESGDSLTSLTRKLASRNADMASFADLVRKSVMDLGITPTQVAPISEPLRPPRGRLGSFKGVAREVDIDVSGSSPALADGNKPRGRRRKRLGDSEFGGIEEVSGEVGVAAAM